MIIRSRDAGVIPPRWVLCVGVTLLLCAAGGCDTPVAVDYAHVDAGTTVLETSPGCNPSPYDVRAAIGDGSHLSYPQAPPNWFMLDLGQTRRIKAIEIDWRYTDKSPDDFNIQFGSAPGQWRDKLEVRGIGAQGKYWYRILEAPVTARYVRFEVLTLKGIAWTVVNRFSLYGTGRIPRLVDELSEVYGWLSPHAEKILSAAGQLGVAGGLELTKRADECALYGELLAGDAEISGEQWQAMQSAWPELQQAAYDAEAAASVAQARRGAADEPFLLAAVSPMRTVFRHIWPDATSKDVSLRCARNEWESGQVAIGAHGEALRDVRVRWEPLKGPVELAPEALDVNLVCYVKTQAAPYLTHHVGWWPDGLTQVAPFDLPAGQVQPLWVIAKIPGEAPPGTYRSTITVQPEGMQARSIPVTVHVWDFALPTRVSLPNIFGLSSLNVEAWYRSEKLKWDDLKLAYYDFWLDHRLNPTSLYGQMIPDVQDLDYCLERGMNTFIMKYIYSGGARLTEEYFQTSLAELAEWDKLLRERDLYDKAIAYLADEPAKKETVHAEIKRRSGIIHERFPQMRRLLVLSRPIDPDFDGFVDLWCPIVGTLDWDDVKRRKAAGETVWWYTVGSFFLLDRPAAESRSMPWLTWKHDLDGMLYWVIQSSWRKPNSPSKFKVTPGDTMWEQFVTAGSGDANGIGNLVYPGPGGRPLSSIRLELLREGMEDYEYLSMLAKADEAGDAKALLDVPQTIAVEYEVGHMGDEILSRRNQLGEALDRMFGRKAAN